MEQTLPQFPVWVVGLFTALIVFLGDLFKGGYKQPMVWVSVALGQVLCIWLGFDLFARADLTPSASTVGYILTGLMLSATASKIVYPISAAAIEVARTLRTTP